MVATSLISSARLAGYEIEDLLGQGGMGVVFRARQTDLARTVALKVITPGWAGDAAYRSLFRREAKLAASLQHPHVIEVYDFGDIAGQLYLAMRFVDGVDLARVIAEEGRVRPERAADMIAQTAEALDAAHCAGLVHRDVKPGNILVTDRDAGDYVYLTDFGLTKQLDVTTLTATGGLVGTAAYMAPEQASGESVDPRADVYSLGCVLYHLLTGAVPFPREGVMAQLYAHATQPPPRPRDVVPDLPEVFDEIVLTAMAKRPAERYQSARDLGRAVRTASLLGAPESTESRMALVHSHQQPRRPGLDLAHAWYEVDDLAIGSEFAGHRIDRVAGVGATGHVYRATHVGLGRVVALKLIKPAFSRDETFRNRFQREARVTALLDHPNVVTVYSHGETDGRPYIALRYIDGPSLAELLRSEGGRLAPARAAWIIAQVAAALDAAHAHGIVHRDPKAGNVLVEGEIGRERAYLSDFGLCKNLTGSVLTLPGQAVGSMDYMAPEQIKGEPITAAADIYHLGCVLYECLTGAAVFAHLQGMRSLWAHLQDPPPSIREKVPSLSKSLDEVVQIALAKNPVSRYPSAGSLADAALAAANAGSGEGADC
ncbi:MAG: serine/threonine-protein kinase [Solirubrobacteraceae bacterium]